MSRVLVTGANGFVGKALCAKLKDSDYELRLALHQQRSNNASVDCEAFQTAMNIIEP